MKICLLTTGFPRFEGDFCGVFLLDLARALAGAGAGVRVVCPHDAGIPAAEDWGPVEIRRFRYALPARAQKLAYGGGIPSNMSRSWLARAEAPPFLAAMAAAAARHGRHADLVHAQWAISGFAAAAGRRLACHRRPLVLTVRGSDLRRMTGAASRWMTRQALRSAARVLAVSEDLHGEVLRRGVPAERAALMPNGVDLALFGRRSREEARRALGLSPAASLVLFVGQVAAVKNPLALAEAAAALGDVRPPVEFHVAGDGPEAGALLELAARLGAGDRVAVHGLRPHSEIPDWLAAADLLVLPSLSEGRPNVVLEAMAAGRPVVATRVGGVPELVVDGETGLLAGPGDAEGLSGAIRRLLVDGELRTCMGLAGRRRLEAMGLSWPAIAARHLRLYEDVLAGR